MADARHLHQLSTILQQGDCTLCYRQLVEIFFTNSTKKVQKITFNFDNWRLKINLEKIPSSPPPILFYEKAQKLKFEKTKKKSKKKYFINYKYSEV
jgi:hypothetical protein